MFQCTHESLFLSSVTQQYGIIGYLTNVYPIRCADDILLASYQEEPQIVLNTLDCVRHEFGLLMWTRPDTVDNDRLPNVSYCRLTVGVGCAMPLANREPEAFLVILPLRYYSRTGQIVFLPSFHGDRRCKFG